MKPRCRSPPAEAHRRKPRPPGFSAATDRSVAACPMPCPESHSFRRTPHMRPRPESRDVTFPAHRAPPIQRKIVVPQVLWELGKIRHFFAIFSPISQDSSAVSCVIQRFSRVAIIALFAPFQGFPRLSAAFSKRWIGDPATQKLRAGEARSFGQDNKKGGTGTGAAQTRWRQNLTLSFYGWCRAETPLAVPSQSGRRKSPVVPGTSKWRTTRPERSPRRCGSVPAPSAPPPR